MLRIYGHAASINVRKVLWTCVELGLDVAQENWGGAFRSVTDPAFLALNPVGMIPVIDDDGTIVWESNTILRYLAASRGRTDLLPNDPRGRAEIERWMDWQVSDFNNSWRIPVNAFVRKNPENPAAIARSMATCSQMVGVIDAQLARSGAYLCGDQFSLADIPIGLSIHRWKSLPADKPTLAHVELYYERLCERAGFRDFGRDGGP